MKRLVLLTMVFLLNGSFAPKGGGNVQYLSNYQTVEQRMAYKVAVLNSKVKHFEDKMKVFTMLQHRTDSLIFLSNNIKP